MNLPRRNFSRTRAGQRGFTMIEALTAMLMAGIMFTALYAGLHSGFRIIKMARENTRATQIMIEHMEICRLYRWEKLTNTGGFLNTNPIVVPYYPVGAGANGSSLNFTSRVILEPVATGTSYADDMRKLTVRVDWETMGSTNRTKMMSTYVTRNGLQNYVW
jgi:prepilin-type N-terminal cleavage/methylation domain-containing protein